MGENVPDFIQKLYRMVNEETNNSLLRWDNKGESFIIVDTLEFSKCILPVHFKHSNFQSFIRQLNKYGFNKVKTNAPTVDNKNWVFRHSLFLRDKPHLLSEIKRKMVTNKRIFDTGEEGENLALKNEINLLKSRHNNEIVQLYNIIYEQKTQIDLIIDLLKQTVSDSRVIEPICNLGNSIENKINQYQDYIKEDSKEEVWDSRCKPNILIVEDDRICRALYCKILKELGCEYDEASNGDEAVEKMKNKNFDIVLMDIWMPKLDGLSATRSIRAFNTTTPIIAITADNYFDKMAYLEQGIDEVLCKPLKPDKLAHLLQIHYKKIKKSEYYSFSSN